MSSKHIPIRMCAVTREKMPKNELLRFVYDVKEGLVKLDLGERIRGRGLNLKPDLDTFEQAIKRKLFDRAWDIKTTPDNIDQLRNIVKQSINSKPENAKVVRISKAELDNLKEKK